LAFELGTHDMFVMVNTFITHDEFKDTAAALDKARLNKQITEAYQIFNVCNDVHVIATFHHLPPMPFIVDHYETYMPAKEQAIRFKERCDWYSRTVKLYLAMSTRLAYCVSKTGKLELKEFPRDALPRYVTRTEKYHVEGKYVYVSEPDIDDDGCIIKADNGRIQRSDVCYLRSKVLLQVQGERVLSLGYFQHPIHRMWIGYENALAHYIHVLKQEFLSRGHKTIVSVRYDSERIFYPWWTMCKHVQLTHRASLIRKETSREEKEWYSRRPDFDRKVLSNYLDLGYIWTCNLTVHQIVILIEDKKKPNLQAICAPISADYKPRKSQAQLRQKSRIHKYAYSGPYKLDQEGFVELVFVK